MAAEIQKVKLGNEDFYKILDSDFMRPFFMSIVSDSNHWMFILSNGGLTAGRKNAEYALFPYYTDDKITESAEITGSKSIFRIHSDDKTFVWEPFSERMFGVYKVSRNLYKSVYSNKIIFEEINHDLELCFMYEWNTSDAFGFVKKSTLINQAKEKRSITILDGIQNIVPYGVGSELQRNVSNLTDAYKRSELQKDCGIGIFALSAIIVDKAEPSEALKANIVWSLGFDKPKHLLSSPQLKNFRSNRDIYEETDVKGEKGAYFIYDEIELSPNAEKDWMIIANVNQNHSAICSLSETIKNTKDLIQFIEKDIDSGTQNLVELNASADALQFTADDLQDTRHFSNVLFNIMRGGIFDFNYQIEKWDFKNYLQKANHKVYEETLLLLQQLPEKFSVFELRSVVEKSENINFERLATEYLPLKFSRRHGDPSRPWNQFSINTKSELDGSKILDYQGNWRDIFQNWEALAHSYPEFSEGMIFKFLNASTFDGYNPYRVTKDGFDWETIEPDNPWSYIGYWGDHQIIYLLKFLEFVENHRPGELENLFDKDYFVYANVPYRIKSYEEILKHPKDTIVFDHASDKRIREKCDKNGADGALLGSALNEIHHVNFIEKILATVLSKVSNFIPEAGIWMNTQRPEWNDANNALVGNGVSMVTLCYLRRFLTFLNKIVSGSQKEQIEISSELSACFLAIAGTLKKFKPLLSGNINDEDRKSVMDGLGKAGSDFRDTIYNVGFSGNKSTVSSQQLQNFIETTNQFLEHSIKANKREDNLYHAYNLMSSDNDSVQVSHLSEMLEGQVGVLSSGYLSAEESAELLDALKKSSLFRKDQYSYILYPNKNLPGFLEKNSIPKESVEESQLLKKMVADNNVQIIEKDVKGNFHFNGNFKNAHDVDAALNTLANPEYQTLAAKEKRWILKIFEDVFNHKEFTGRSGTFYGFEGLGSIYWHMVSKLQLAVVETCINAINTNSSAEITGRLVNQYYEINEGIGVHKSPTLYGAFPTDPYSHTPSGKGAQQPGMTGQVKEDIISRFGELGVFVKEGKLFFQPGLLRKKEFLPQSKTVNFIDIFSKQHELLLEKGSLCFTYCQVPVIYTIATDEGLEVIYSDGKKEKINALNLDKETSKKVFERTGAIFQIKVFLKENILL